MVKTENLSSMEESWKEVFIRSRFVPPPSQTVHRAVESHITQSRGFQLGLRRVTAAHLHQELSEGEQNLSYQLRVTLFDRNHRHFFGKTWKSLPQRMKNNKIIFNEGASGFFSHVQHYQADSRALEKRPSFVPVRTTCIFQGLHPIWLDVILYFHTSLRFPSTVVVLELVSVSPRPDGSQQALGRSFTILEPFTNEPETQAADGDRRLNLHHGSPRSLLHPLVKDYNSLLKTIDGSHLDCVFKSHPALVSIIHLLPENVIVSGNENIPGLAASPSGDALLKPQLLEMVPLTLNRVTISLQPSLERFESQLLQLINADCHNTVSFEPTLSSVKYHIVLLPLPELLLNHK